ncbi:hypothetical protein FHW04_004542 [Pantoea sp. AN62]|uniref:hypothetical protein n=1 Tax=Pantoea TaxID=53335 RepID=UPI000A2399A9|nr:MULTISPECIES: hypothetical protein [Pantoea]MCQ5472818.1 hypothetical protein [Pantoea brenneri]MDU4748668.1 hypothetical protein [Pantoea sp.]ORM54215.1 hypothetical protein HA39_17870 [Pantoea brenneri]OXM18678.1 hypothetical protein CBI35_21825 [Pantoea sp. AV62]
MKNVHEKFYGQAVREVERDGVIRHDLWAKAGALSVGDREAAKAIYIDLLARQFSEGAHRAEREDLKQTALGLVQLAGQQSKVLGFRALCWGVWVALVVAIFMFGQHWSNNLYEYYMGAHGAEVVHGLDNKEREIITLDDGKTIMGPTEREYSEAAATVRIPRYKETLPADFPQVAFDSAKEGFISLRIKYGDAAALSLIRGNEKANVLLNQLEDKRNPDYLSAITKYPLPWLLLAVLFGGSLGLVTWFALRTHRRGRFEAPLWMQI